MKYVKYLGAFVAFIQLANARPVGEVEVDSACKGITPTLCNIRDFFAGPEIIGAKFAGSGSVAGNQSFFQEEFKTVWGKDTDSNQIGVQIINPNGTQGFEDGLLEYCDASTLTCEEYVCYGLCDIENLDAIADLLPTDESGEIVGQIDFIREPTTSSFTGSGSVSTQAAVAMQVNRLREKYPELTGKGIKIGIISNSFNLGIFNVSVSTTPEQDIASGDLPANVKILRESPFNFLFNDEGRATAQVIHDIVPEAELLFYTGFLPGLFKESIEALVAEGCHVILDDVSKCRMCYFPNCSFPSVCVCACDMFILEPQDIEQYCGQRPFYSILFLQDPRGQNRFSNLAPAQKQPTMLQKRTEWHTSPWREISARIRGKAGATRTHHVLKLQDLKNMNRATTLVAETLFKHSLLISVH